MLATTFDRFDEERVNRYKLEWLFWMAILLSGISVVHPFVADDWYRYNYRLPYCTSSTATVMSTVSKYGILYYATLDAKYL